MNETDKKCPNCGGTMEFRPSTGKMWCPYCESEFDIKHEDPQSTIGVEQDFLSAEFTENTDWGVATRTIICKACGGETVYDANTLSTVCPYCGSNQVMETQANTMAPGGVCPFCITKEQAASKFKTWIKKKLFCPSQAKKNCEPEAFKGVYIPMWTFDTDTLTEFTAKYGIDREYKDSEGNSHTRTDWYSVSGTHREFIDDHPVIATDRYDTSMFNELLPFNTANNKAYKPEYIAGFAAEKYSVGLKAAWERAKNSIVNILRSNITKKIKRENNADHVDKLKTKSNFYDIKYKYILAPVWISSYKYKNKVYNMMVNGETGRISGKSPVSALRVALAIIIALLVLIILLKLLGL
ncbi:MAG: hypothetical protein J5879_08300 [Clostridia bacterium]|nr:hypothetical protein [Clostridia bacterium]